MLNIYLKVVALIAMLIAYFVFVPQLISAASTELMLLGFGVTAVFLPLVFLLGKSILSAKGFRKNEDA